MYDLKEEIKREVERGWREGRTFFRYCIPMENVPTLAKELLEGIRVPKIEVLTYRSHLYDKAEMDNTYFNFFSTSMYMVERDPGLRLVIVDGGSSSEMEKVLQNQLNYSIPPAILFFEGTTK